MPGPERVDPAVTPGSAADPTTARPAAAGAVAPVTNPGSRFDGTVHADVHADEVAQGRWAADPDNTKLVVLARASRARTGARQGAAVRDGTGRTYTAATVTLPSLQLTALQAAVVLAAASGAAALAAGAVVTELGPAGHPPAVTAADLAAVRDLGGPATPILLAGPDGTVLRAVTS